jgi:HD-GYP domain-containing protein (c-di-GMP phosphodiesterase class II)
MGLEDAIFNSLISNTKALSVSLKYRDDLTHQHSERVKGLSLEMGLRSGLSQNEMNALSIAATFHDIGKIGIPDQILMKPAKFDEAEWEIMKQHSDIGEKIILSTELEGSHHLACLIRHHHEYYSGSGYPDNLSGEDIPVCSRIISIADSYDAMSVTRVYHHERTHQEVMTILHEETGDKFDPELMRVFCELIEFSKFKTNKI